MKCRNELSKSHLRCKLTISFSKKVVPLIICVGSLFLRSVSYCLLKEVYASQQIHDGVVDLEQFLYGRRLIGLEVFD